MAEILVHFDEPRRGEDGRLYVAQVHGRLSSGRRWEAWIEFVPNDGGDPIRTGRETEQFTRGDLRYWASRLTGEYLDDVLARSLMQTPTIPYYPPDPPSAEAVNAAEHTVFETDVLVRLTPALDPFALYQERGIYSLRQALRSLDAMQLQDIIGTYGIPVGDTNDVLRTFEDALAEQIVAEVQQRVGSNRLHATGPGAHTHN